MTKIVASTYTVALYQSYNNMTIIYQESQHGTQVSFRRENMYHASLSCLKSCVDTHKETQWIKCIYITNNQWNWAFLDLNLWTEKAIERIYFMKEKKDNTHKESNLDPT